MNAALAHSAIPNLHVLIHLVVLTARVFLAFLEMVHIVKVNIKKRKWKLLFLLCKFEKISKL